MLVTFTDILRICGVSLIIGMFIGAIIAAVAGGKR